MKITSYLFTEGKEAADHLIKMRETAEQVFESHGEHLRWEDYVAVTFTDTFIGQVAHSGMKTVLKFTEFGLEDDRNCLAIRIGNKLVWKEKLARAQIRAQIMGYV